MYNVSINIEKQKFLRAIKRRSLLVKFLILFMFLIVVVRLIQLQVFRSNELQQVALSQYVRPSKLPALRGKIYDANGNILASSTTALKVAIDPKSIKIKPEVVVSLSRFLSKITSRPQKYYLSKFDTSKSYVCLEKELSLIYKDELSKHNCFGVIVQEMQKRLYPYGTIAGQILGGMLSENQGKDGIESFFNNELKGTDGSVINYRDGKREIKRVIDYPRIEPKNGNSIYLTIDLTYQSIAEEELKKGARKYSAESGMVIIMNPKTGEVLAIAQYPEFDPSDSSPENLANRSIRAITDAVEPGSMFKIVTAAAALENKKVKPEQVFYAENGKYRCQIGKNSFVNITDTHPYDYLTFEQALEVSSNIVFAKISYLVGSESVYKMARDMGFGSKTGIELPGETRGKLVSPNKWSGSTLQAMSRGYEVQTSPLQIITAYSAIANNGVLVKPYIVKKIVDQNSETIFENQPLVIRRVLSESNAKLLTKMLVSVVEGKRGTARSAQIEGMQIAGKTGTARLLVNGKYSSENLLASFVGYFPAEDPKVVCLVMLRNPKINGSIAGMGGSTSAPIFKEIAERIRTSFDLNKKSMDIKYAFDSDTSDGIKIMDLRNLSRSVAINILEKFPLKVTVIGEGQLVMDQTPTAGSIIKKGSEIKLFCYLSRENNTYDLIEVPNVVGLPLKRAINILLSVGLQFSVHGSGTVISQSPDPGVSAAPNTIVSLLCEEKKIAEAY